MSLTIAAPLHTPTSALDPSADRARAWLDLLPALDLPTFVPHHLPAIVERSPAAALAAARAASCPDLFIVHAPDRAAGEPVIAEVARLCGTTSERVLVLSPDPAAADRIAERLLKAGCDGVIRALADDENPVRPRPLVGKATTVAVLAARMEQLPREAAAAVAAADARLTAVEQLIEWNENLAQLDAEAARLVMRAEEIAAEVRGESGTPFAQQLDALRAESEAARGRMEGEWQSLGIRHASLVEHLANLKQQHAAVVAESAKKPGILSRLFGGAKPGPDAATLDKQIREAEAEIAASDVRLTELRTQIDALVPAREADREKQILNEIAARRTDCDARASELVAGRQRLAADVERLGRTAGLDPAATRELISLRDAATRDLLAAREHANTVTRAAPELARYALIESQVVVGTPGSLHADPVFDRGPAPSAPPFDLLVLDRAEELTEPDFVQLARLARRWVLVGDVPPAEVPRTPNNGVAGRRGPSRNGRPAGMSFVARLARMLDRETWGFEPDRLICRLALPTADSRYEMVCEPLLDRPEIELRFLADENDELILAEVAFPGGTAVAAARSFLFHQLGEVLIRPCGPVQWHCEPTAITACWPAAEHAAPAEWIDLEPGVREKIVGHGLAAFTAAVVFDPAAGWDADRAAAWLEEHTPAPSASRFAAVPAASPASHRYA